MNLSYVDPATNRFVMQVDYMNDAVPLNGNQSDLGRRSVRIHSNNLYGDGVYILKASFMPQGCGTWPAFWSDAPSNWPSGGEIDIIEGVNGEGANIASLHTAQACHVPNVTQLQQGQQRESNCSYQPGCSTRFDNIASYGLGFNGNGGGYFALVRDTTVGGHGIGVWFWPMNLNASSIPTEVVAATKQAPTVVNLDDAMQKWGKPQAFFGSDTGDASNGTNCPMHQIFQNHELVFDTT
ncbi:hypothetical protein MPSI1_001939 [Malassezia psittaci]|uniref:GH16 domain-containing protein n=1 Tax=Malassezia psittaci TaxID=1821823 RepID=A0AAF0F5N8_9BASI|nr:hypothetical protein MPSI1_001939 [Malassezia psittaci]